MANRIRELREERKLSVPAFARVIGMADRTVRHWESGRSNPTSRNASRIARALGIPVSELWSTGAPATQQPPVSSTATTNEIQPKVASAIIARDGKILMTRRRPHKGPVLWNFVTGKVEPGETPEQTVLREVHDEVGLEVVVDRQLGARLHPASGRQMIYFACRIVAGEPTITDHEENAEIRWSSLDEAEELLAPTGGVWQPIREYMEQPGSVPATQA